MTESVSHPDEPSTLEDDLILDALGLLDESESVELQQLWKQLPASEREAARVLQAEWAAENSFPASVWTKECNRRFLNILIPGRIYKKCFVSI